MGDERQQPDSVVRGYMVPPFDDDEDQAEARRLLANAADPNLPQVDIPCLRRRRDETLCNCGGEHDLYIWRDDPDWWSCGLCDGRVRRLTSVEITARERD